MPLGVGGSSQGGSKESLPAVACVWLPGAPSSVPQQVYASALEGWRVLCCGMRFCMCATRVLFAVIGAIEYFCLFRMVVDVKCQSVCFMGASDSIPGRGMGNGCLDGSSSRRLCSCTCSVSGFECTIAEVFTSVLGVFPGTCVLLVRVRLGSASVDVSSLFMGCENKGPGYLTPGSPSARNSAPGLMTDYTVPFTNNLVCTFCTALSILPLARSVRQRQP